MANQFNTIENLGNIPILREDDEIEVLNFNYDFNGSSVELPESKIQLENLMINIVTLNVRLMTAFLLVNEKENENEIILKENVENFNYNFDGEKIILPNSKKNIEKLMKNVIILNARIIIKYVSMNKIYDQIITTELTKGTRIFIKEEPVIQNFIEKTKIITEKESVVSNFIPKNNGKFWDDETDD